MKILAVPALLLLAGLAFEAHAATTTTVVDIPAATGGTQRYLHIRPDAPIATLIHVPGGNGTLGIQADGSMPTQTGQCSPTDRSRGAITGAGVAIAMVDATSNGFTYNYEDILEVVRHVRARDNVPVWVIGGSASTGTIDFLARNLPGDVGAVFYSPQRPSSATSAIRRPTLVLYHSGDIDQFGTPYFNALTAAIVRERVVVTGGTNVGCGFHLFNGTEGEFAAAITSFVTRHNAATREAGQNYQGLWYRGEAESGWGVNIAHQGDIFFVSWFTYDTDGSQMWLVAPDVRKGTGNTFSGALFRTTGPAFDTTPFNPAMLGFTQVGTVQLGFADGDNGTFAYTVNGVTQSKPIVRQVFGPLPSCTAGGSTGTPGVLNFQDLWYAGEAERGWGVNITHQGDILFATWFTYDSSGRGMWIVGPRMERTSGNVFAGSLFRTTGPAFNANPWNPASVTASPVGTGTFTFTSQGAGTFSYVVNGISQTRNIVRQAFGSPATLCR